MEKFKFENENIREESLEEKYNAYREAQDEEDEIMDKIAKELESVKDKKEAERIVNEKYIHIMNAAMSKTRDAFDLWKEAQENEVKKEKNKINDIDK